MQTPVKVKYKKIVVIGTDCLGFYFFLILYCSGYQKCVSACIHPLSKCICSDQSQIFVLVFIVVVVAFKDTV
jgi:hypothetical protein